MRLFGIAAATILLAATAVPADARRGGGCGRTVGCGPPGMISADMPGELAPLLDPGLAVPAGGGAAGARQTIGATGGSRGACTTDPAGRTACR